MHPAVAEDREMVEKCKWFVPERAYKSSTLRSFTGPLENQAKSMKSMCSEQKLKLQRLLQEVCDTFHTLCGYLLINILSVPLRVSSYLSCLSFPYCWYILKCCSQEKSQNKKKEHFDANKT